MEEHSHTYNFAQVSDPAEYGPAFLAVMRAEYAAHVVGLETWEPEFRGRSELTWSTDGSDHPELRRSDLNKAGQLFLVNYPGMRGALLGVPATRHNEDSELAGLSDLDLIAEVTHAAVHRGRGLSLRGAEAMKELRRRCRCATYWLRQSSGLEPLDFSRLDRALITDFSISRVAKVILAMLKCARKGHRLGLSYSSDQICEIAECSERAVRYAMAELEVLGIAWRMSMWRDPINAAVRPVDQDRNILFPGPQWMETIDRGLRDDEIRRSDVERAETLWARRRYVARERRKYLRRCKRAHERRRPKPRPPGCAPVSWEDWWRERAMSEVEIQATREAIEAIESRSSGVCASDAAAMSSGDLDASDLLSDARADDRACARKELGAAREKLMEGTTEERLAMPPLKIEVECISSNWAARNTAPPLRSVNSSEEKDRPCTPERRPAYRRAGSIGGILSRLADVGLDSRESRGGEWYDGRSRSGDHVPPGVELSRAGPAPDRSPSHLALMGSNSLTSGARNAPGDSDPPSAENSRCDFAELLREERAKRPLSFLRDLV